MVAWGEERASSTSHLNRSFIVPHMRLSARVVRTGMKRGRLCYCWKFLRYRSWRFFFPFFFLNLGDLVANIRRYMLRGPEAGGSEVACRCPAIAASCPAPSGYRQAFKEQDGPSARHLWPVDLHSYRPVGQCMCMQPGSHGLLESKPKSCVY